MEAYHHHHYSQQGSIFLRYPPPPPQPCYCPWRNLHTTNPFSLSRISASPNNFPPWDSNAETSPPPNFNFNNTKGNGRGRGKPQQQQEYEDDEEEEYGKKRRRWSDEPPGTKEEGYSGVLEEALDTIWIFKVLKSYSWMLPIILASSLLASGPKALLMALAIPLGQSALTLAFEKLWGRSESKPKRKYRMRRKRSSVNNVRVEEDEEQEPEENQNQKTNKGNSGMQSWVVENNGSVNRSSGETPRFGGWDDLERSRPTARSSQARKGSQRRPMEDGKLSRRERKSNTPLLLRLLLAIFPFLGTWTKML